MADAPGPARKAAGEVFLYLENAYGSTRQKIDESELIIARHYEPLEARLREAEEALRDVKQDIDVCDWRCSCCSVDCPDCEPPVGDPDGK